MIKQIYIFLIGFLLLISCGETKEEVPEDVLPKEQFVALLVEVQLMESYCQDTYVRPDVYKELLKKSVDSLLEANDVSPEEYEASFDYYSMDPKTMFEIYEQVLDAINQMQVTTNAVVKDSVSKSD